MTIPFFPVLPGRGWPITRAPLWKTLKQESASGKETTIPAWTFPKYQWSVPFTTLRAAASYNEFQTLLGFINTLNGGALPFYYTDSIDNAVTAQVFGLGDGTTAAFQLVRAMGGYAELIQSPAGVPVISVAGVATAAFTVSNVGVITFTAPPAAGALLTWSGSFNWLCRLDEDTAEFSMSMPKLLELGKLSFTSKKL